jgi:excisionase family DNA binding protein
MSSTASSAGRADGRELLITVPEACSRLSVGRSTLYGLLRQGVVPSVLVGSSRWVVVSGLEDYVRRLIARNEEGDA